MTVSNICAGVNQSAHGSNLNYRHDAGATARRIDAKEAKRLLELLDADQDIFLFTSLDDDKERGQIAHECVRKMARAGKEAERLRKATGDNSEAIDALNAVIAAIRRDMPDGTQTKLGCIDSLLKWMQRRQDAGYNVTVCVQTMKGNKRRKEDVTAFRAIFAEMDAKQLKEWPIAPSIVIETSPDRYHVYWLIDVETPMAAAVWDGVMRRIVTEYGSDPAAKDCARTMRLPGTWNLKTGRAPHHVRVVSAEGYRYSADEITEAFPPVEIKRPDADKPNWKRFKPQGDDLDRLRAPLEEIPADEYQDWIRVGMALHAESGGSSSGLSMWGAWSARAGNYANGECEYRWGTFKSGGACNGGTILGMASDYGWRPANSKATPHKTAAKASNGVKVLREPAPERSSDTVGLAVEYSELRIAQDFASKYRDKFLHVAEIGMWMSWNGKVWLKKAEKKVLSAISRELKLAQDAASISKSLTQKEIRALTSARIVRGVEFMAKTEPSLQADIDDFDSDDFLINSQDGIIDLRTGEMAPHDPNARMTRIMKGSKRRSRIKWMKFLDDVTNKNDKLKEYLQTVAGYILTGDTREQVFLFFFGKGGNGKGVFLSTLEEILNDYCEVGNMSTFTKSKWGMEDRFALAKFAGARLVTAQEVAVRQTWNEAIMKKLSGQDTITAQFKGKDEFSYKPKFKLLLAGNDAPLFATTDEAMRRRFRLVPFEQQLAKENINKNLKFELAEEYSGIIEWMVDGCIKWQQKGLVTPEEILKASEEHMSDAEDTLVWEEHITKCLSDDDGKLMDCKVRVDAIIKGMGILLKDHNERTEERVRDVLKKLGFVKKKGVRFDGKPVGGFVMGSGEREMKSTDFGAF